MKNWSYDALRNEIFSNGQHGEKKRDEHDDESVWIYSDTHTHILWVKLSSLFLKKIKTSFSRFFPFEI